LEALIAKVQQKGKKKKLIICGDWNINLLQENNHVQALQSILLAYNLINTVTSPTRVSRSSVSMIDVMVTSKQFNENFTEVVNVGYTDHLAQVLCVCK
jgi:exonuclease III